VDVPPEIVTLAVGIAGSAFGTYVGLKVGLVRLQGRFDAYSQRVDEKLADYKSRQEVLGKRTHDLNQDSLIHDFELEDIMRKLELPRKKRQNWRLDM
jgi:hypothetical protein